jgi:hypothetical protein
MEDAVMKALEPDKAYADKMIDYSFTRLESIESSARRSGILLLAFVALNELLTRAAITGASVGGFQLTDLSFPRKFLPALIAYEYYEIMSLFVHELQLSRLYRSLMEVAHPSVWTAGLAISIAPHFSPLFGSGIKREGPRVVAFVVNVLSFTTAAFFILLPPLYVIFRGVVPELNDSPDLVSWIGAIVAGLYVCYGIMVWYLGTHKPERLVSQNQP